MGKITISMVGGAALRVNVAQISVYWRGDDDWHTTLVMASGSQYAVTEHPDAIDDLLVGIGAHTYA